MADVINAKTSAAAGAKAFSFANPTSRFVGHAVCDDVEWLNGLSNPIIESYHPNGTGHRYGFTPTVSTPLTGSALKVGASTLKRAAASSERLTAQQRTYAAADSSIKLEVVLTPDLSSSRVKAAAARAGVDLSSRASVDASDRAWSARQATQHAATQ